MGFGVDSAAALNDTCFNWTNFYNWKGGWPAFVGRYFGGGYNSTAGEFSYIKSVTGGVCRYVAPLQAGDSSRQEKGGSTGYQNGVNDATLTLSNIVNFLSSGELVIPSNSTVYVYLDVEAGVSITSNYWAGWSNTIFNYALSNGLEPFFPAIYTQFTLQNGVYLPQPSVQNALNNACANYSTLDVTCYGFWTNEPETSRMCAPDGAPDWSALGQFTQQLCNTSSRVPNLLYQYAEPCECVTSGYSHYAGQSNCSDFFSCNGTPYDNNNLDMDGSDSTGAESYMLTIG